MKRREFIKQVSAGVAVASLPVVIISKKSDLIGEWYHIVAQCEDGITSYWTNGESIDAVAYWNRKLTADERSVLHDYFRGCGTPYEEVHNG